ncbi:MAG: EXLDI protein [Ktedonobacterales bacterium]|nr:EXLDI protein [Ktedonobacterales bacterium]
MMPNKTIYVSDADAPLFERAQDLAGGSLSAAIVQALRRYVASEELAESGEIVIKVGANGAYRQQRFTGRQVGKFYVPMPDGARASTYHVYVTNKGNFAVYVKELPNWAKMARRNWSDPANWEQYRNGWWTPTSRLEVYPTLAELEAHIPAELFAAVKAIVADSPDGIEDLDI